MNISLPASMKAWVEEQTRTGRYGNSSDVVRDLIRRGTGPGRQDRPYATAD